MTLYRVSFPCATSILTCIGLVWSSKSYMPSLLLIGVSDTGVRHHSQFIGTDEGNQKMHGGGYERRDVHTPLRSQWASEVD